MKKHKYLIAIKKNFVIKLKSIYNIMFRYSVIESIYESKKNVEVIIKKVYLKNANGGEDLCFLIKDYQLTIEKEEF